jgi:hypothetical protein
MLLPFEVPVDPDADEARDLLIQELAKPQYQAARPTLFDQIAQAFWDWLNSLNIGGIEGPPAFGLGVVLVLIAAAIVVGILIFGLPRLNRRSSVAGSLFGDDDARDADAMRRDARAVARGLAERTVLTVTPGTTASGFATRAGTAFPELAEEFAASARYFDEVRYLGREGTREQFEQVAALEGRARTLRPVIQKVDA